ncbi:alpha/beta fold hydrolase [Dinoroseobacter sp. S76]|uniref:alpha/beta fold hydrolase n=1 Tax=Dinoroseobacter sp. S76 TaxID=3415124 RepID=UPI003C7B89CF
MMSTTLQQFEGLGQIGLQDRGQGAPLILLHGVGMQSAAWAPQLDVLSRTHRVIALDLPGHGGSAPLAGVPGLPDYVAWLSDVVSAIGLGRVSLAGHSMGALIATGFAVTRPDVVRRVALLNGTYRRGPAARQAVIARAAQIRAGHMDLETPLERWFGQDPSTDHLRAQVRSWLAAVDPKGYGDAYAAFAEGDAVYADRLGQFPGPLLALTGADDPNSTPAMSRAMAQAAPQGRAVILEGARHMANLTAPAAVNDALADWLAQSDEMRQRA